MPSKVADFVRARCLNCTREFESITRLPSQKVCPQCYYESRGDLTAALTEFVWAAGYETGMQRREREDRAEIVAKIRELLPLKDLIRLCHPDKHPEERKQLATDTTALLLELRNVLEDAA